MVLNQGKAKCQIIIIIAMTVLTLINVHVVAETKPISYDYVIITTDDLIDSLTDFKNWKQELGFSVNITTASWISNHYNGKDEPEKIRNFLIDNYKKWEIKYVLIVGSIDSVPMRYCYPDPANHNLNDWIVPTDYYYADLTGNWDADGDGYYGEGKNNSKAPSEAGPFNSTDELCEFFFQFWDDKADFNAEVYVGRIPVDNSDIVETICNKSIAFEQSKDSWKNKVLLLGVLDSIYQGLIEDAWTSDIGYYMDLLRRKVFEPNGYQVTTLYEKEGLRRCPLICNDTINEENVLNYWTEGYGIVVWSGHGSNTGSYRTVWAYDDGDNIAEADQSEIKSYPFIRIENILNLDDNKPSIVFSTSCNNACPDSFDRDNNLGSALMKNGAVAFIGASRISHRGGGTFPDDEWDGTLAICRYFFDYLLGENQTCGQALYNSKIYCYDIIHMYDSLNNMYGLNLYGDPSLEITQFQEENSLPSDGEEQNDESYDDNNNSTSGFELIFMLLAIALVLFWQLRRI